MSNAQTATFGEFPVATLRARRDDSAQAGPAYNWGSNWATGALGGEVEADLGAFLAWCLKRRMEIR